eukprot:CAMPEP_0171702918 /NCGR_PEP_ID=MMETSP0991-20121206/11856_1 /TAXON_ID=483369 /ORGANISM="non described non described, Strain CCMP2098" /LENGTH=311 /DNA_ID=CAMNT_0012292301 /DNA_START=105 /DNA_END=1040 /DNA_ORIENTATION=-
MNQDKISNSNVGILEPKDKETTGHLEAERSKGISDLNTISFNKNEIPDSSWSPPCTLEVDYWSRTPACALAKERHVAKVDSNSSISREELVLSTTLLGVDVALERNMFPYDTPEDIGHWTLWSRQEMRHVEICKFLEKWCAENAPEVFEWNYEENSHRSFDVPHVHVFLRFAPLLKSPRSIYSSSPEELSFSGASSLGRIRSSAPQQAQVSSAGQETNSKRSFSALVLVTNSSDEEDQCDSCEESEDTSGKQSCCIQGAKRKRFETNVEDRETTEERTHKHSCSISAMCQLSDLGGGDFTVYTEAKHDAGF